MGILNSIFGKTSKEQERSHVNWIPLTSIEQLSEIKKLSKVETVFIFKHSTRCGISSMVIKRFEKLFDNDMQNLKVYYLDLLSFRDISNEIGHIFQVMHQSPQLLIIRNETAVYHASHYDITSTKLEEYI
tara:strand:- start:136 stop:525 length:390 start_codon:yes stop_codon:yes gene_type:complete